MSLSSKCSIFILEKVAAQMPSQHNQTWLPLYGLPCKHACVYQRVGMRRRTQPELRLGAPAECGLLVLRADVTGLEGALLCTALVSVRQMPACSHLKVTLKGNPYKRMYVGACKALGVGGLIPGVGRRCGDPTCVL